MEVTEKVVTCFEVNWLKIRHDKFTIIFEILIIDLNAAQSFQ